MFYQMPVNQETINLVKSPWTLPESLAYVDDKLIPFKAGGTLQWRLSEDV